MTVFIGEIACIDPRIQFKTILFNHIVAYICSRFVCVVATQESSHQWNKFLLCDTKPMVQNSAGLDTFVNGGHKLIYQEFDIIDATYCPYGYNVMHLLRYYIAVIDIMYCLY